MRFETSKSHTLLVSLDPGNCYHKFAETRSAHKSVIAHPTTPLSSEEDPPKRNHSRTWLPIRYERPKKDCDEIWPSHCRIERSRRAPAGPERLKAADIDTAALRCVVVTRCSDPTVARTMIWEKSAKVGAPGCVNAAGSLRQK